MFEQLFYANIYSSECIDVHENNVYYSYERAYKKRCFWFIYLSLSIVCVCQQPDAAAVEKPAAADENRRAGMMLIRVGSIPTSVTCWRVFFERGGGVKKADLSAQYRDSRSGPALNGAQHLGTLVVYGRSKLPVCLLEQFEHSWRQNSGIVRWLVNFVRKKV